MENLGLRGVFLGIPGGLLEFFVSSLTVFNVKKSYCTTMLLIKRKLYSMHLAIRKVFITVD